MGSDLGPHEVKWLGHSSGGRGNDNDGLRLPPGGRSPLAARLCHLDSKGSL